MDAEMKACVDRFVEEIVALAQRAGAEELAAASQQVAALLGAAEPTRTASGRPSSRKPRPPRRAARSGSQPEPAPASSVTRAEPSPAVKTAQPEPQPAAAVARTLTDASQAPSPETILTEATSNEPAPVLSELEALILDAVRSLGRAAATEIVKRCGLPNGSVHVVLRSLVAGGRVARAETDRGIEYGLVSPGAVRPFKRAKSSASVNDSPA